MSMEQACGLPSLQLWPICSWKSLTLRPSILQLTLRDYGEGMLMPPLSSERQNTTINFCNTSPPLTHTFSSHRRIQTQRVPFFFWTFNFTRSRQHSTHHSLQGNLPILTKTYIWTATIICVLSILCFTPPQMWLEQFVPTLN